MKNKTKINLSILFILIILSNINIIFAGEGDEPQTTEGFTMNEMVDALIELEKVFTKDKDDKYECNYFECCVVYKDKEKDKKDKCVELKTKKVKLK